MMLTTPFMSSLSFCSFKHFFITYNNCSALDSSPHFANMNAARFAATVSLVEFYYAC